MDVPEDDDCAFLTTDVLLKELQKRFDSILVVGLVWLDTTHVRHETAVLYTEALRGMALAEIGKQRILDDYVKTRKTKSRKRKRRFDDERDDGSGES